MMRLHLLQLLPAVLFATFFGTVLTAQQRNDDKKVIVTIRNTEADGSEVSNTIIKRGRAAENFDLQQYIYDNTKDKKDAVVLIGDDAETGVVNEAPKFECAKSCNKAGVACWSNTTDVFNRGFLGVNDEGKNDNGPGVPVTITRNSAAAKAGLKDGDIITALNETPVEAFDDISKFMNKAKPGDAVKVAYSRDGKPATTTATLGKSSDAWSFSWKDEEKEACLGVYTQTYMKGTEHGSKVTGFTAQSAARDAEIKTGDVITAVNGVRVKSHQDVWDEIARYKPADNISVAFVRDGKSMQVEATLKACKMNESVIVVPKAAASGREGLPDYERKLYLKDFSVYPNPAQDMVNVSFTAEAVPTTVSLFDLTGKMLYSQNLHDFDGSYNQRFDLSAYAKGAVMVQVRQGEKIASEQVVVK